MLNSLIQTASASGSIAPAQLTTNILIGIVLAFFTYRQAKAAGSDKAVLWTIIVLLLGLLGYILFWVVEARKYKKN